MTAFTDFTMESITGDQIDFADYRSRSKDAYSKLGTTLKGHGTDLIGVVREVPGQVKDALTAEAKPARKAAAKKKAATKK